MISGRGIRSRGRGKQPAHSVRREPTPVRTWHGPVHRPASCRSLSSECRLAMRMLAAGRQRRFPRSFVEPCLEVRNPCSSRAIVSAICRKIAWASGGMRFQSSGDIRSMPVMSPKSSNWGKSNFPADSPRRESAYDLMNKPPPNTNERWRNDLQTFKCHSACPSFGPHRERTAPRA